jgi:GNAT superfamily N-acetyltransferase
LAVGDAALLQEVYQASADDFLDAAGAPLEPSQAARDLGEAAGDPGRHILGIFLNDTLAGTIHLRFEDEPAQTRLELVLLAPDRRRQGLGTWALRILEAWLARATPSEAVALAVAAPNHAAQSFFLANGYTYTGRTTRLLVGATRLRMLEMRKTLSA